MDEDGSITYSMIEVVVNRLARKANHYAQRSRCRCTLQIWVRLRRKGDHAYLLRLARELDDAILHLATE